MDLLNASYGYGKSPLRPASKKQQHRVYLFGQGISYSLSPSINASMFAAADVPWSYSIYETTSRERFLDVLRAADTIGASITIPNKVTLMPVLDDLTAEARAIGAVNTVFVRLDAHGQKRYIGTNTDCVGIRDALQTSMSGVPKAAECAPALVVGAGGAARSAIYALWNWFPCSEIYIVNRIKSEVDALAASLRSSIPTLRLRHIETIQDAQTLPPPCLVIGTVPDAPPAGADEALAWRICETLLQRRPPQRQQQDGGGGGGNVLLDMCYNPPRTRLVKAAAAAGWATVLGTEVLLRVNVAQQTLWLEQPPSDACIRAARVALATTRGGAKL